MERMKAFALLARLIPLSLAACSKSSGEAIYTATTAATRPQMYSRLGTSNGAPVYRLNRQGVVRKRPRTAEILRDFLAPKLEPFLEPRALRTWNRKQKIVEKL
jgi:hypothetical protein